MTPFVSGRRALVVATSVAADSNRTQEPPAVTLGASLGPLPGRPAAVREASHIRGRSPPRSVARTTCERPPVACPTRSAAVVAKATTVPSTLLAGAKQAPAPACP